MLVIGPISPSSLICIRRPVAKEPAQRVRLSGQPCSRSLFTKRPGRTVSKAPLTSRVSSEALLPLFRASSTSWVRQVIRSTAERRGSAPNCWLARTLLVTAIHDIWRAISLSSPLPRTERSAIGLYDLGEERSSFLGF